jgi:hypothetical protein
MGIKSLDSSWDRKFFELGWQPPDFQALCEKYIDPDPQELMLGVVETGNHIGNLLEVRKWEDNDNRTIVGFNSYHFNARPLTGQTILPENLIHGFLFITSNRFIVVGGNNFQIYFDEITHSFGAGLNKDRTNRHLKESGLTRYKISGDTFSCHFASRNKGFGFVVLSNEQGFFNKVRGNFYETLPGLIVAINNYPEFPPKSAWD